MEPKGSCEIRGCQNEKENHNKTNQRYVPIECDSFEFVRIYYFNYFLSLLIISFDFITYRSHQFRVANPPYRKFSNVAEFYLCEPMRIFVIPVEP